MREEAVVDGHATAVFVNREVELRRLEDAFEAASSGQSRLVVIEGKAGIGKTTLIEHFLAALGHVRILRASGDEFESHLPFATADQLLRSGDGDSDALGAGSHVAVGLKLLELRGGTHPGPTCLVVDDAHQADPESLRALLFAARRLVTSSVLILLAVRGSADDALPEPWRKLAAPPVGRRLAVRRLTPAHIAALAADMGVAMTPDAAHRLWEHTDGNPLHACAVLRELPSDGIWQYEHRPLPVPRSYGQLIHRQLERCAPEIVDLIEAAAVLGVRAPLQAVLSLVAAEQPLELVDEAIDSGLLRLDERHGAAILEFAHPLTRGAVYAAIPTARRSRLNAAAAMIVHDPLAKLRHRVEAATVVDDALLRELEQFARGEMARGAWSGAVSSLLAASRLTQSSGRPRALRAGGDRGHHVLGRRSCRSAARRADELR